MKKWLSGVAIAIVVILLIGIYIRFADFSPKNPNEELLRRINQLERKIDSINNKKDSLRIVIDSTHVKIITNEKHYQERINTILVQSASSDSGFIANYIRLYSKQDTLLNSK